VALGGNVTVDTIVAQGCRPIGQPMFVTRCERNVLHEIDGRRTIVVMQALHDTLSPPPPRSEQPILEGSTGTNPGDPGDPDGAPTWRPPFAARAPEEVTEVPRMPNSGFLNDEAESTVRDRSPSGLLPSSPPKFVSTKPPKVEKKK
jgi:hypothetical protein